jgi:two-component system nitrogen regulation response regulator NtrX
MASEILIVDDEKDIRTLIAGILADEGYETREARDADSALGEVGGRVPNLVLLDIWLHGSRLDGVGVLKELVAHYPGLPVIMISGHGNIETAVQTIRQGAYDFIEKPFEADRLLLSVERALHTSRLVRENQELRQRAGGGAEMVGASAAANFVRQAVLKVAPTGSRVLISGPPGCGKEVVARLLHNESHRAEGPFVAINAAAMAPERVEEELFGIEDDSSSGGPRKIGVFEQAHGGTLLLDEVADMPLETQGKILRVLQDQTFQRLGGNRKIAVDVRVVAATSKDLTVEIANARFREDLYYRLAVVPIKVPSLKDRREDVPDLVSHFIERAVAASGLQPRILADEAMAVLQTCDWPGNVRQLRNVIDWVLIMAPGDTHEPVSVEMLPSEMLEATPAVLRPQNGGEIMALPLREAREMFEREYLQAQVSRFGNNISRTATFVGMERSALHRKLKSLGITGEERERG